MTSQSPWAFQSGFLSDNLLASFSQLSARSWNQTRRKQWVRYGEDVMSLDFHSCPSIYINPDTQPSLFSFLPSVLGDLSYWSYVHTPSKKNQFILSMVLREKLECPNTRSKIGLILNQFHETPKRVRCPVFLFYHSLCGGSSRPEAWFQGSQETRLGHLPLKGSIREMSGGEARRESIQCSHTGMERGPASLSLGYWQWASGLYRLG